MNEFKKVLKILGKFSNEVLKLNNYFLQLLELFQNSKISIWNAQMITPILEIQFTIYSEKYNITTNIYFSDDSENQCFEIDVNRQYLLREITKSFSYITRFYYTAYSETTYQKRRN